MAQNFLSPGEHLEYTATAAMTAGTFYKIGLFIACCLGTYAIGDTAELRIVGVFKPVPKATGQAWTVGALVYWDDTAKNFTTTASGNTLAGKVWQPALSADATGAIRLQP